MRQYHSPAQMALTAAALAYFKQVVKLSATCFQVELEQFSSCFRVTRHAGSASAGLSCFHWFNKSRTALWVAQL